MKPISGLLLFVSLAILPINLFGQCTANPSSPSVTICSPAGGATVNSPIHVVALTTAVSSPVKLMMVYVDGSLAYQVAAATVDTYVSTSAGAHQIKVQAQDGWDRLFYASASVTVSSAAAAAPTITSLSQTSGIPGNHVTITGTKFVSGATVRFGGVASSSVVVSSATQLVATAPAHEPGTVDVQVVNPDGQQATMYSSYRIGRVLLKDGFDAGSFASWTATWDSTDTLINANKTYVHSGNYSAQIHYHICSNCGAAHQDSNRWFEKDFTATNGFPNGLQHFFVKGFVYFKSPERGGAVNGVQRKIFYFKAPQAPGLDYLWAVVLTSDAVPSPTDGLPQIGLYLGRVPKSGCGLPCGDQNFYGSSNELGNDPTVVNGIAKIDRDRWVPMEMEVQVNDTCCSNGAIRVWVDNKLKFQKSQIVVRDPSFTVGVTRVEIGRQVDRVNFTPVDEYRYWDDLTIADAFIE